MHSVDNKVIAEIEKCEKMERNMEAGGQKR